MSHSGWVVSGKSLSLSEPPFMLLHTIMKVILDQIAYVKVPSSQQLLHKS